MKTLFSIIFFFLSFASAASELGTELKLAIHQNGKPAFGVLYTYGDDPDGKSYLLTITPKVSQLERSRRLVWNFYGEKVGYLLPWDLNRATYLTTFQIKVNNNSAIETILKNQGLAPNKSPIFFILADPSTMQPIYFFPISTMCTKYPSHFGDLTNGAACDQISNP